MNVNKRNTAPNVFGICPVCKKDFSKYVHPNRIKKGHGKFCSRQCRNKDRCKPYAKTVCAYCEKEIQIREYCLRKFNFCNRKCKEAAQSLASGDKFISMRPEHYGTGNGKNDYREKALFFYGSKCRICGYDIEQALEVHHRDSNRSHNEIENLDVLCATHHNEYQFGIRNYDDK